MYWLVVSNGFTDLWTEGKILTAKDEYKQSDYQNKRIHDSHAKTTDADYWFSKLTSYNMDPPIDNTIKDNIFGQMKEILESVKTLYIPKLEVYNETKYGFEVFGIDFMVTTDFKVYILEINGLDVGYEPIIPKQFTKKDGPWLPEYREFSKNYFEWIYSNVIKTII